MTWDDTARELIDMGLKPFPVHPEDHADPKRRKAPVYKWKQWQTEWPDDAQLEAWAKSAPDAEWAVVCGQDSGYVVLDIDSVDLLDSAKAMGLCTSPVIARTKRGFHYYYRHPGNGPLKNKVGSSVARHDKDWPRVSGLDFKADGGYVRAAPSGVIKWLCDVDLTEAPIWPGYQFERSHLQYYDKADAAGLGFAELQAMTPMEEFIDAAEKQGGKIREGGRNQAFARLCGYLASGASGLSITEAEQRAHELADKYLEGFDYDEADRTWQSIVEMEKRQNPERFETATPRLSSRFKAITAANLDDYAATLPEPPKPIIEHLFQRGAATLVNGYSGSGKSNFVLGSLMAACDPHHLNKFVGPLFIQETPKVLYLDPENSEHTIIDRMRSMRTMANSGDNLHVLPARLFNDGDWEDTAFDFTNRPEAMDELIAMVRQGDYTAVVIDTVRSHFPGMEEGKAESWTGYNRLIMRLKRLGCSVVLLHHMNKTRDDGFQSESGSAHQLTNIETQIFVQPGVYDELQARRMGGIWIEDKKNYVRSLEPGGDSVAIDQGILMDNGLLGSDEVLANISRITFGKARDRQEQHNHPLLIGQARSMVDDSVRLVGMRTLRQVVHRHFSLARAAGESDPHKTVAAIMKLPLAEVRRTMASVGF